MSLPRKRSSRSERGRIKRRLFCKPDEPGDPAGASGRDPELSVAVDTL